MLHRQVISDTGPIFISSRLACLAVGAREFSGLSPSVLGDSSCLVLIWVAVTVRGAAEGMILRGPAEVSRCARVPLCGTLIGELQAFGAGDCLRGYMVSPGPLCPVGATQRRLPRPLAHVRLSGATLLSVGMPRRRGPLVSWRRPTPSVQKEGRMSG